jgi:hypothetical protein
LETEEIAKEIKGFLSEDAKYTLLGRWLQSYTGKRGDSCSSACYYCLAAGNFAHLLNDEQRLVLENKPISPMSLLKYFRFSRQIEEFALKEFVASNQDLGAHLQAQIQAYEQSQKAKLNKITLDLEQLRDMNEGLQDQQEREYNSSAKPPR